MARVFVPGYINTIERLMAEKAQLLERLSGLLDVLADYPELLAEDGDIGEEVDLARALLEQFEDGRRPPHPIPETKKENDR